MSGGKVRLRTEKKKKTRTNHRKLIRFLRFSQNVKYILLLLSKWVSIIIFLLVQFGSGLS